MDMHDLEDFAHSHLSHLLNLNQLVEKEAAYMRLAEDRFYNKYPCIVITAKGQPDVATRLFLKKLKTTLQIPVLGLVDSDPYGAFLRGTLEGGSHVQCD